MLSYLCINQLNSGSFSGTEVQASQQTDVVNKLADEIEKSKTLCKELEDDLAKIMNDIGDARVSIILLSTNSMFTLSNYNMM